MPLGESQVLQNITHRLCGIYCKFRKVDIDFLIGDKIAIEVKTTQKIQDKHLKGLRTLMEKGIFLQYIMVSFDKTNRETIDGIECLHWSKFLELLWKNELKS